MAVKCTDCGRFTAVLGSSADIYDMVLMCLSHEHWRCLACTEKLGPVQSNARPADGDMTPYQTDHR